MVQPLTLAFTKHVQRPLENPCLKQSLKLKLRTIRFLHIVSRTLQNLHVAPSRLSLRITNIADALVNRLAMLP